MVRGADEAVDREQIDEVTAALEALNCVLPEDSDVSVLLQRVCEQVIRAIGADMASVTLLHDGQPTTAACTDERVYNLDIDQYRAGEGPCLEAARTRMIVRVDVEEAHERWPTFVQAAVEAGVTNYLAAPLYIHSAHAGALNLYSDRGRSFHETDSKLLELYVTAVEGIIQAFARYHEARVHAANLRKALLSRAVIEQAKGILMGSNKLTADQAFAMLVRQSQYDNIKVRDLAARIVAKANASSSLGVGE